MLSIAACGRVREANAVAFSGNLVPCLWPGYSHVRAHSCLYHEKLYEINHLAVRL